MNSSLAMGPAFGSHNEISSDPLLICSQLSFISLGFCMMRKLLFMFWSWTSLPSFISLNLLKFSGFSVAAQNALFKILLFIFALRQYCYCKVKVIYHKVPAKIPYVSPISKKIKEISLDKLISLSCPSLRKGFICHPLLCNGHIQTLWASLFAEFIAERKVNFERELITAPDGGIIALDWTKQPPADTRKTKSNAKPTVYLFVCHGLTGGSHETYVQELVDIAKRKYGYESIVMNFRGCSGTPVKTPKLYAGSYTGDVELSIQHIQKRDPTAVLIGVGFSLGSNVLTKYCGQYGKKCPLIGMVSVGNPYDFLGVTRALHRSFIGKYLYSAAMSKSLVRMFSKHLNVFHNAEWIDLDQIMSSKTVQDFDASATIKQFGYATVHEYYRFGSSAQDIPYIRVPAFFLTAMDDPISLNEVIPYIEFSANPYVIFASTRLGGHLGWFRASWDSLFVPKHRWYSQPVGEFLHAIIESHLSLPAEAKVKDIDALTGSPWHALPGQAHKDREIILDSKKANSLSSLYPGSKVPVMESRKWSVVHHPKHIVDLLIQNKKFKATFIALLLLYFDKRVKSITIAAFLTGALFIKKEEKN